MWTLLVLSQILSLLSMAAIEIVIRNRVSLNVGQQIRAPRWAPPVSVSSKDATRRRSARLISPATRCFSSGKHIPAPPIPRSTARRLRLTGRVPVSGFGSGTTARPEWTLPTSRQRRCAPSGRSRPSTSATGSAASWPASAPRTAARRSSRTPPSSAPSASAAPPLSRRSAPRPPVSGPTLPAWPASPAATSSTSACTSSSSPPPRWWKRAITAVTTLGTRDQPRICHTSASYMET